MGAVTWMPSLARKQLVLADMDSSLSCDMRGRWSGPPSHAALGRDELVQQSSAVTMRWSHWVTFAQQQRRSVDVGKTSSASKIDLSRACESEGQEELRGAIRSH